MSKIRIVSDNPQEPLRAYDESGQMIEGVTSVLIEKNEGEDTVAVISVLNPRIDIVAQDVTGKAPKDISPQIASMFGKKEPTRQ